MKVKRMENRADTRTVEGKVRRGRLYNSMRGWWQELFGANTGGMENESEEA